MAGSRVLAALLIVVLSALAADAQAAWYDSNWQYRKALTIDSAQVPSDQTNFAVLISITDTDLAAGARSDGFDIVFTDSAGTTKLDHEIESYSSGTGALVAWVRVPTLTSSANNTVYLYYGYASATDQQNAPGVWDANYVGVWHLDESPANGVAGHDESTGNPTDGTPLNFNGAVGSRTNGVGQIDGADELDGVDDRVDAGSDAVLDDLGPLTISAWVKPDTYGASNAPTVIRKDSGSGSGRWLFGIDNTAPESNSLEFLKGHTTTTLDVASATGVIVIGAWQQVVATWDGSVNVSGVHLYVNGLETAYGATQAGVGTPISDAIENVVFGAAGDGTSALHGSIDEVHISNTVRSADWIQTEYNNQNSPGVGGFLASIGSEETESGGSSCGAGQTVYSTATSTTYTVPAGCDTLQVKAWGAGGGGGTSGQVTAGGAGGGGGYAEGTITVTPSEGLAIVLGGGGPGGTSPAAGDGGGGNGVTAAGGGTGGNEGDSKGGGAGGGGGYAAVKRGATFLIQAGGGGGGGGGGEQSGAAGGAGGAGGGASGIVGSNGAGAGGGPGTSSSGGSAGTGGTSGSADSGGNGANGGGSNGDGGGGGGGAGHFGGGGGGRSSDRSGGGGGGGSSLVTGTSTQEIAGAGTAAGNNGDADYGGTASLGGAAGGANGNPGRIVLIPSGSGGPVAQGFKDPTADAARAGTAAIAPANAYTADDTYGELKDTTQHDYRTYGFCIAPGATIQGVEIRTEWHTTKATDTGFLTLQLIDSAGLLVGTSKTTPTIDGTTDVTHTMGGPADTWGASLTDVIVNDGNFGVSLLYTKTAGGGGNKAFVDNVDIQVFYTGGTGTCEPIAHWDFDEGSGQTAADSSGFANDGQLGSTTGVDANDPSWLCVSGGYALDFNGTSDYVDLGSPASLDLTTTFTVAAWVKWKGGNPDAVIYASGNANADHYRLDVNNCNANGLSLREDGEVCHPATSNLLPADTWHHVAVIKDGDTGTNLAFYLDGVSDGTASAGTSGATGLKRIGARTEFTDQFFDGAIDDLRIYDRALSGAEITALAGTAPSDCAAPPVEAGQNYYYRPPVPDFPTMSSTWTAVSDCSLSFTPGSTSENWLVVATGQVRSSSIGDTSTGFVRLRVEGTVEGEAGVQSNPADAETGFYMMQRVTGTSAQQDIDVQAQDPFADGSTTTVEQCSITAFLIPSDADFQWTEVAGTSGNCPDTPDTTVLTHQFTPSSAGDT